MGSNKPPLADRSQDVYRAGPHPLDSFFRPHSVAVIGATDREGSVGRSILWNLLKNPFGGVVYPVNPKHKSVLGVKAYARIGDIPEKVDLAVIVTPAATVPSLVGECAMAEVPAVTIISAGFREAGPAGKILEQKTIGAARLGNIRLIGPNCLGVMNPGYGLNATFAAEMALPGNVAFLSQSGALGTSILDWSLSAKVGLSAFVSVGSMVDVGWGDLIDYFGNDSNTKSIVIYMESIGDARAFLSAAREVVLTKPIVVIKAGRTQAAAKAAASHTGALTGNDEVLDAAFARCGVLRVNSISEVFNLADILAKQPRPKGPRLAIVTNAGGPGVLATDHLILRGGELAELSAETKQALDAALPPAWSHGNPVDMLGDADPERYDKTLKSVVKDSQSDGMLVILTPQPMTQPTQVADKLCSYAKTDGKPVFASWMGGGQVAEGVERLSAAGIPVFPYPDSAVQAFVDLWRFSYNLKGLYETPQQLPEFEGKPPDREGASLILKSIRDKGRVLLTEVESKRLLVSYGIPVVPTVTAATPEEAVQKAKAFGFPVVLKLYSETLTHKTDVGGVQLNLRSDEGIRKAFQAIEESVNEKAGPGHFQGVSVQPMVKQGGQEVIIGSSLDPQFGPVLLFGMGGQMVEVLKDVALDLPPLNTNLARRLMARTKVYKALQGVRGAKPVDMAALEQLLVRFSYLVVEQPLIQEIDINPLLASPEGLLALDCRVVLQPVGIDPKTLPRPAIRPYPSQYVTSFELKDGTEVTLRPIRPEDEPMVVKYHETLSDNSVFLRYFQPLQLSQRVAHERMTRICFTDYDREMALVAVRKNPKDGMPEVLGIARLSRVRNLEEAEYSILVSDKVQNQGLGSRMMKALLDVGRAEKLKRIVGYILPENGRMQAVSAKVGFRHRKVLGDEMILAEIEL